MSFTHSVSLSDASRQEKRRFTHAILQQVVGCKDGGSFICAWLSTVLGNSFTCSFHLNIIGNSSPCIQIVADRIAVA